MLLVATGKPLSTYMFPARPESDFRGIVWSHFHGRSLLVVGFFSGADARFSYELCSFPTSGGACGRWIPVPEEWDEVLYSTSYGSEDIHIAFTGGGRDQLRGPLIRGSDGRVLWSGALVVEGVFTYLKPRNRDEWMIADRDRWASLRRTVALGGDATIYRQASQIAVPDMDEATIQRIEKETAQPVLALERSDVLRSRAAELSARLRRKFSNYVSGPSSRLP
jgi:hypothetical protein